MVFPSSIFGQPLNILLVFVGYVPAGEYNVDRVNYNPVSLNNSTSNSSSIQVWPLSQFYAVGSL